MANILRSLLLDMHANGYLPDGWGGDLIDLDCVAKDFAIKRFIMAQPRDSDQSWLNELFPPAFTAAYQVTRALINSLYRDQYQFTLLWNSMVDSADSKDDLDECFISEALWSEREVPDACALLQTNPSRFVLEVAEKFYLHCESYLREELQDAWTNIKTWEPA